jgi:preprotein translocase subunit SecG
MFTFLLILQTIVAAGLVGVILMQRSEGGGLGVGGSSSGFMTARGAADFLTRSTAILGTIFVILSIALAAIAGSTREPVKIDTTLANQVAPVLPPSANQAAPADSQQQAATNDAATDNKQAPLVPLGQ